MKSLNHLIILLGLQIGLLKESGGTIHKMSYIFRFFLIINSLSLSFLIFAINKEITMEWIEFYFYSLVSFLIENSIFNKLIIDNLFELLNFSSYLIYFMIIVILSVISIFLIMYLSDDNIDENTLSNIEPANDAFLPAYLGYFFVALSIPDIKIFFLVFGIIAIFIFYSRISYFNPMFFLFGFNFFYVINKNNVKILLITKRELKRTENIEFNELKRITNYTFIDIRKERQ